MASDDPQVVGARVRALREALGLSREALGEEIGVTRVAVRNMELSEDYAPRAAVLSRLLRALRVELVDLTDAGRPIQQVVEEVWRGAGARGTVPLAGGNHRMGGPPEPVLLEGVAVRRSGRIIEWRNRVEVLSAAVAAARQPVALYAEEAFVVDGQQVQAGDVIVLDRAAPWADGRVCLFRQDFRFVLARVALEGGEVVWSGERGEPHRAPMKTLALVGVAMGRSPAYDAW